MKFFSRFIAVFLSPLMVSLPLQSQFPDSAGERVVDAVLQLRVVPPTPDAVESVRKGLTVEVLDGAGSVVPRASVVLRFLDADPSPVFADGTHSAVLYTDEGGRATFREINWGSDVQSVSVRITAAKGQVHAGILYQATRERDMQASSVPLRPAVEQTAAEKPRVFLPPVAEAPRPHVMISTGKQPGTLPTPEGSPEGNTTATDVDTETNIPIRHILSSNSDAQSDGHPNISITHSGGALESSGGFGHSKMKWLTILALAGGAGAALAFVNKGKSSTSSSSTTIGTPTVSLGHP